MKSLYVRGGKLIKLQKSWQDNLFGTRKQKVENNTDVSVKKLIY